MIEDIETIKAIASDSKARVDRIVINYEQLKKENEELKKEVEYWKNEYYYLKANPEEA